MKAKSLEVLILLFLSVLIMSVSCQKQKSEWKGTIEEMFGGYEEIPHEVKLSWDDYHNAFIYLNIDDKGRIFTRSYEKVPERDEYYYDVFDQEGRYIAKIPLRMRPMVWKKNKFYTIEEDEQGYQAVKRYKVTWKY